MPKDFRTKGRSKQLIDALVNVGGEIRLAKILKISRQSINQWNDIPLRRLAAVRKAANLD